LQGCMNRLGLRAIFMGARSHRPCRLATAVYGLGMEWHGMGHRAARVGRTSSAVRGPDRHSSPSRRAEALVFGVCTDGTAGSGIGSNRIRDRRWERHRIKWVSNRADGDGEGRVSMPTVSYTGWNHVHGVFNVCTQALACHAMPRCDRHADGEPLWQFMVVSIVPLRLAMVRPRSARIAALMCAVER
jgi:hypothetical protein